MRLRIIAAVALLVASHAAEARVTSRRAARGAAPRVALHELRAATGPHDWTQLEAPLLLDPLAPGPAPGTALREVLPPGVLAALEAAAARHDAPPSRTDGLSWRDLRPQDESGRRIVPLAMGRF